MTGASSSGDSEAPVSSAVTGSVTAVCWEVAGSVTAVCSAVTGSAVSGSAITGPTVVGSVAAGSVVAGSGLVVSMGEASGGVAARSSWLGWGGSVRGRSMTGAGMAWIGGNVRCSATGPRVVAGVTERSTSDGKDGAGADALTRCSRGGTTGAGA